MKIRPSKNPHEYNSPCLVLTFFANSGYSDVFKQGVKRVSEEFNGRYTGCYVCVKCKVKSQGYIYTYTNGKKYFAVDGS